PKVEARIFHPDRALNQLWPVDYLTGSALEPCPSGSANGLCLASNVGTLPGRECDDARVTQAAESRDPPFELVLLAWIGKRLFDELAHLGRQFSRVVWILLHLGQKAPGVAKFARG